ncbi:MAG: hypothetical protein V2A73_22470 [Pseudomonadota bacterium]
MSYSSMNPIITTSAPVASASTIEVAETRGRTAQSPPTTGSAFSVFVRHGTGAMLRGIEAGATALGGPVLAAAVRQVGSSLDSSSAALPASPLDTPTKEQSTLDGVRALQEQAQSFNAEYLALQERVQQENRQFTTVSNVLKAKHETAKMAIGNIRS